MSTQEIQARQLTHPRLAYLPADAARIDTLQAGITRWAGQQSQTTFTESVHSHVNSMFLLLKAINRYFPQLSSEIDFQKVADLLYLHDFKEIGTGDFPRRGNARYRIDRQIHEQKEDAIYERDWKNTLPQRAQQVISEYNPKNPSKEFLFANAFDKAHSCLKGLRHFYNPAVYGTEIDAEQTHTYRMTLEDMFAPLTQLREQLSDEASQELTILVDIVMDRFAQAGYSLLVQEFSR